MSEYRVRSLLVAIGTLVLCAPSQIALGASARRVEIRWDFTAPTVRQHLEVWVNCTHGADVMTCSNKDVQKLVTPSAEAFELKATDRVVLVAIFAKASGTAEIKYTVTGTSLDDKDLDKLKGLFGATAGGTPDQKTGTKPLERTKEEKDASAKPVIDPLVAGGKLNAVFELHTKDDGGKDKVSDTSGDITFAIAREPPRVTVSYGLGMSTAANPTVSINKTSTIVSFLKDGKAQQAYQQVIALKDSEVTFKPIQSLIVLANFRVTGAVYASLGAPVNDKLFESPIIGGTYRLQAGKAGLNITAGIQFSHEIEILPGSGFAQGQLIDPTLGLTADDVPTEKRWHRRFAMAFTIDFQ